MSTSFVKRPWTRWLVPGVAAAGVITAGILLPNTASADALPPRTAEQLLVDVQQAKVDGLSGTVSESANLGLPQLPASMTGTDTSITSLISGTHTARVWTSGETKSRVAVQAAGQETDVVRNGADVWQWSSSDKSVTHVVVPKDAAKKPSASASEVPLTPQQAAQKAVQTMGATTAISVAANDNVAGRAAYELVLTPKDAASRVASVKIAIDGATKVPLRVQVYSSRLTTPAIEVGFTSVDFAVPADSVFAFTPPAGAKVTTKNATAPDKTTVTKADKAKIAKAQPTIKGTGWTQIATGRVDLAAMAAGAQQGAKAQASTPDVKRLLALLPTISGTWGSGHVLDGTLVSVVITDDGRYAAGAVAPSALIAALPAK